MQGVNQNSLLIGLPSGIVN